MQLKSIGMALGLIAAAGVVVARAGNPLSPSPKAGAAAASSQLILPVAVVVASPPTISEVLDLILGGGDARDHGPAAEASRTTSSGFSAGTEEARIAAMLRMRTPDADRANRIAAALVREGKRAGIGATLLVGVLLTEDPDLEPRATSSVGARGLMQVMPLHAGKWGCPSANLFDIESNICHGVRILADNLNHSRDLPTALQRYNGCVSGRNTPDCYLYAGKVYSYARRTAAGAGETISARTAFAYLNPPRIGIRGKLPRRAGSIIIPKDLLVD